ncbi:hypothetical protein M8J76_011111 [Diaphorina citri]|nr:hypothetical protein M8J75_010830 [Diaphorina citri]KAI5737216.1 hypothetical protein M8J76_011111 [Diaphorina citri]
MAESTDVREGARVITCLQSMIKLSSQIEKVEAHKKRFAGHIENIYRKIDNELDDMLSVATIKEAKPRRVRKKKEEAPHPDAIPEENEEGDEGNTVAPPKNQEMGTFIIPSDNTASEPGMPGPSGDIAQDTTVSSTTSRPRRAAVDAAAEKIKAMMEMTGNKKLRRPSDFNQNDHCNYNVYNQTITKTDECFPRTKRRKGSSNITSSNFFSSTMIHHSSPLQKLIGPADGNKSLEMSIIPPHSDTSIMEVEEQYSVRTRTRTIRNKKPDEETMLEKKEEKGAKKGKENITNNKQEEDSSTEKDTSSKSRTKKNSETSKNKSSTKQDSVDGGSTSDSESGVRTRTRVTKKTVNKVEDLPVIGQSDSDEGGNNKVTAKTIGEKIKDKVQMFENGVNGSMDPNDQSSEGRVTRTKTRKMNKSSEDEKTKAPADLFKVPLAVKNTKDLKKPVVKKPTDKAKDPPAKAAAARDQADREKREHALKLEREREEKLKLKRTRDEKLKEEVEKKRQAALAKIEQQKREQEAARAARLQEIIEEENRKEAQRKKEQEMQERKAQQAKLAEKLKAQTAKLPGVKKDQVAPVEQNYSISEDPIPSDEDEENNTKRPIPSWARPMNRNIVLADQIYAAELLPKFFENPADFNPSVTDLFGEENVRVRPRTSSAVWNRTVYE